MTPVDAVGANLWTLFVVAVWRVLLMSRVVSVVYRLRVVPAFFVVMLVADAAVITATGLAPTPIINLMGGIRLSEQDALLAGVTGLVMTLSVLSAPVWIIGALIGTGLFEPRWPERRDSGEAPRSHGLLVAAAASVVVWAPFLALTQPEQVRRREAERLLRGGEIAEALRVMSSRDAGDYPPHWDLPPRLGYGERQPALASVRGAMRAEWPADWVAAVYLEKTRRELRRRLRAYWGPTDWSDIVEDLEAYDDVLETAQQSREAVAFLLAFDPTLTEADRAALARLESLAATDEPGR